MERLIMAATFEKIENLAKNANGKYKISDIISNKVKRTIFTIE